MRKAHGRKRYHDGLPASCGIRPVSDDGKGYGQAAQGHYSARCLHRVRMGCVVMIRGERVWVETLLVARVGTFLDYQGAECYGGLNLARVELDDTPGRIFQVARRQVRFAR